MKYAIVKEARSQTERNHTFWLFLVDRHLDHTRWWTYKKWSIKWFKSKEEAMERASKIKYGEVRIMDEKEANRAVWENEVCPPTNFMYYEHPCSSEALGQS